MVNLALKEMICHLETLVHLVMPNFSTIEPVKNLQAYSNYKTNKIQIISNKRDLLLSQRKKGII
jgi:hypothetical protein